MVLKKHTSKYILTAEILDPISWYFWRNYRKMSKFD